MRFRIDELLVDWEIARQEQRPLTPEELCRDCPELLDELKLEIEQLAKTSWLFQADAETLPEPKSFDRSVAFVSAPELYRSVEQSDILTDELAAVLRHEPRPFDKESAADLAKRLVAKEVLTQYQADVLMGVNSGPLQLDRYVVLEQIGAGGMGEVFRARHRSMHRVVAIKILPAQSVNSKDRRSRFYREIKAVAQLNHPNIVTAYDAHESDGVCFMVMELVVGDDLDHWVKKNGPLELSLASQAIYQIASAADYAHQNGIIHRDLKPANILMTKQGQAKLLDLGLSRFRQDSLEERSKNTSITNEQVPMGTVAFMSPEQAMDAHSANVQSDVYSLGCTFYCLLTGRPPFDFASPVETIVAHRETPIESRLDTNEIPDCVKPIIQQMMQKNAADRFQSMREVADSVKPFISADSTTSVSATWNSGASYGDFVASVDDVKSGGRKHWYASPLVWITALLLGIGSWAAVNSLINRDRSSDEIQDVDQNDLAKWVLNGGGAVTADTEFGTQVFTEVAAIPDGKLEITEIVIGGVADQGSLEKLRYLGRLQSLSIGNVIIETNDVAHIGQLENLTAFSIENCGVDPGLWTALKRLPNLRSLFVSDVVITEENLRQINLLTNLDALAIRNSDIDDDKFELLDGLHKITSLSLSATDVAVEPIKFVAHHNQTSDLDLSNTLVKDSDFEAMDLARSLQLLSLDFCDVGTAAANYASQLPLLEELYLEGTNISDEDLKLLANSKSITYLDIANSKITAEGLQLLVRFPRLTGLSIAGLNIDNESLKQFANLTELTDLNVSGTNIGDEGIDRLSELNLLSLDISNCEVSEAAITRFVRDNPDCEVIVQIELE